MTDLYGWHFLPADRRLANNDGRLVEQGQTLTGPLLDGKPGPLRVCSCGFHGCELMLNALVRAAGPFVEYVRYGGQMEQHPDSYIDLFCSSERTCLYGPRDVSFILHQFACDAAEATLQLATKMTGQPSDPRSAVALEVKRRWLIGAATDKELDAARDAAGVAARAARDGVSDAQMVVYYAIVGAIAQVAHVAGSDAQWAVVDAAMRSVVLAVSPNAEKAAAGAVTWAVGGPAALLSLDGILETRIRTALGMPEKSEAARP